MTGVDGYLRSVETEKQDEGESKKCGFYPVSKNSGLLREMVALSQ